MSGESEQSVSSWTVDSLHAHLRTLIDERDRRYEERFQAQERATELALTGVREEAHAAIVERDKAIQKAELASEKRFESVNEFRAQLADQAASFLTRTEYESKHQALTEKVEVRAETVDEKITTLAAAADRRVSDLIAQSDTKLADMAAKIATTIPRQEVASRLAGLESQIAGLASRLDRGEGRSGGLTAGWGYLVGAVALAATIVGVVIGLR